MNVRNFLSGMLTGRFSNAPKTGFSKLAEQKLFDALVSAGDISYETDSESRQKGLDFKSMMKGDFIICWISSELIR